MKKILVPTDFSACANNAVNFAAQLARILPVEVTLLHAFELMGDLYTDYMGVNKEFNQSQLHEIQNKMAKLKSTIQETEGVIIDHYVSTDRLENSILQTVTDKKIDFIVMGTSGASGLKEKIWGSKTADIIGKSRVPVLAIPSEYKWKRPRKLLLATNHFEKDPAILDFLFEMADLYMAQVHVIVFTNEEKDDPVTYLEHARNIPSYEKMLKQQYKEETLIVAHLFGKAFEEALQHYISENEIDILAMVTYKRSFADRIFHPSITKRMSYHTKIPLLAIPAKIE